MKKLTSIGQLEWLRNKILADTHKGKTEVHVCMTGCRAYGADQVKDAPRRRGPETGPDECGGSPLYRMPWILCKSPGNRHCTFWRAVSGGGPE